MTFAIELADAVSAQLNDAAGAWFQAEREKLRGGVSSSAFSVSLSKASRFAKDTAHLEASTELIRAAQSVAPGTVLERWTLLEATRVALILSLDGLDTEAGAQTIEDAFRYADEGELCALYRSLALLPAPERFRWRAAEGCRTNMRSVFEANVLDTPYPSTQFDEVAWRQAVIKCLFVEAPLWRLVGLDARLDDELARMALDLAEERTSAHRAVYPELWACVGTHGGERGKALLLAQLDDKAAQPAGRAAAAVALVRAGLASELEPRLADERDARVVDAARAALAGATGQTVFGRFRDDD